MKFSAILSCGVLAHRNTVPVSILSEHARAAARQAFPPGVSLLDKGDNDAGGHSTQRMRGGLLPMLYVWIMGKLRR